MYETCPQPPDMDDCKSKKKRCLSGRCVGQAYTEGEECLPGSVFNPDTCLCEDDYDPNVCYSIFTEAVMTNGSYVYDGNIEPCGRPEACDGSEIYWRPGGEGRQLTDLRVDYFEDPEGCGISSRQAYFSYSWGYYCDGEPDGSQRSISAGPLGSTNTHVIIDTVNVYLVPPGCNYTDPECRILAMTIANPYNDGSGC